MAAVALALGLAPSPARACSDAGPPNAACTDGGAGRWIGCTDHAQCPAGQYCNAHGVCACGAASACGASTTSCDDAGCRCCDPDRTRWDGSTCIPSRYWCEGAEPDAATDATSDIASPTDIASPRDGASPADGASPTDVPTIADRSAVLVDVATDDVAAADAGAPGGGGGGGGGCSVGPARTGSAWGALASLVALAAVTARRRRSRG